jgi:hypothetical protein
MVKHRVPLRIELAVLVVPKWWNPHRVSAVELVGEVNEGVQFGSRTNGLDVHQQSY